MIRTRYSILFGMLLGGAIIAAPADAVIRQSGISPSGSAPARFVDPDEQTEQMVDRSQHAAAQGRYDRESAASVMQYGNSGSPSYGPRR